MEYFCPRVFINVILSKILKIIKSLLIIVVTILSKSFVINYQLISLKTFYNILVRISTQYSILNVQIFSNKLK